MSKKPRVLLVWPGSDGPAGGNFGMPQLVLLATYAREKTGAEVVLVDLVAEKLAFGTLDLPKLFTGFDVIGFSVYSSYDWLKCQALAGIARQVNPRAILVAGGYHASARPLEIVAGGFDVCVIGEGERPLVRVIESVQGGAPLREAILGPEPIDDLDALPPSDWSYLERYRKVARKVASQAQVYLSRGCPFDCAFCMERAKREVSWRPLGVERALEEVRSLHRFLDLRGWTLYVADALFGMKKSWRREFLEALAKERLPIDKLWLLIRVDLVEDEDLALFADANCGLGFGLESGDPAHLATIRKAGRLDTYLDRMKDVAAWARERDVPWGANVIVGHPGETRESLARSASYLTDLFLGDRRGVTGFLSVDPFRLYPGSPIDSERSEWEARFGTVFHRTGWWEDGDQEFLSEWVDPSHELRWSERESMSATLMAPILRGLEERFVYRGKARDYFLRAVRDQARLVDAPTRLHYRGRYYAWKRYLGRRAEAEREREADGTLAALCRDRREHRLAAIAKTAQLGVDHPVMGAIARVPRERFVPLDQISESVRDEPIALEAGAAPSATVSAMHAYARAFSLLEVGTGTRLLDLGGGTGYGAAIAAALGAEVVSVEIDPRLHERAVDLAVHDVRCVLGDAVDPAAWGVDPSTIDRVAVGFALEALPAEWAEVLREGTRIVAPLIEGGEQRLVEATVQDKQFSLTKHEAVRYVPRRSVTVSAREEPRRLPQLSGQRS